MAMRREQQGGSSELTSITCAIAVNLSFAKSFGSNQAESVEGKGERAMAILDQEQWNAAKLVMASIVVAMVLAEIGLFIYWSML